MADGAEAVGKPFAANAMNSTHPVDEGSINISLIIPAYNIQDYIREALESALEQSPRFREIIVIDDGSTDGTRSVVASFPDPRIRYFYQPNKGLGPARNAGLDVAIGDYVYFMDGDDILAKGMTKFIQRAFEGSLERPDIVLFSAMDFDHETNARLASSAYFEWKGTGMFPSGPAAMSEAIKRGAFPVCAFLYVFARSLVERSPGPLRFPDILHEDEVFTPALLLRCGSTVISGDVFYKRRVRRGSIMTSPAGRKNVAGYLSAATWWLENAESGPIERRSLFKLRAYRLYASAILYASRAKLGMKATEAMTRMLSPRFAGTATSDYLLSLVSRRLAFAMIGFRGQAGFLLASAFRRLVSLGEGRGVR